MSGKTQIRSAAPGPDDHVLTLCHMLSNRIGRAFAADLEAAGVTVAEWRVLLTLAQQNRACGQHIADRWAMDKMAINRAIAGLRDRRLIAARTNSDDRRIIDLRLTAAGRKTYDHLVPTANDRYRRLMAGLTKTEEREVRRIMVKLIDHTDQQIDLSASGQKQLAMAVSKRST